MAMLGGGTPWSKFISPPILHQTYTARAFFFRRTFSVTAHSSQAPHPVRVRFAPSPTGNLHVGGARTALFNYLFARFLLLLPLLFVVKIQFLFLGMFFFLCC